MGWKSAEVHKAKQGTPLPWPTRLARSRTAFLRQAGDTPAAIDRLALAGDRPCLLRRHRSLNSVPEGRSQEIRLPFFCKGGPTLVGKPFRHHLGDPHTTPERRSRKPHPLINFQLRWRFRG